MRGNKISKNIEINVIEMYQKGFRMENICNKFNIHYSSGYAILKRNNIKSRYKYNLNESFFENIDTEKKAYWLGFITADGYISKDKNYLRIALKKSDDNHLKKFKNDLKTSQIIKYGQSIVKNKKYFNCYISINSKKMINDLKKRGIVSNKTFTIKPYINLDKELQKHYWRGLIDGDGCISIHKDKRKITSIWRLGLSGNKYIINGFKKYIKKRFNTKANYRKGKGCWIFTCGGNQLVKNIITHFYSDAIIFLDRKMELSQQIMNMKDYIRPSKFDYLAREELIIKYKELGEWNKVYNFFKMSISSGQRLKKKRNIIWI